MPTVPSWMRGALIVGYPESSGKTDVCRSGLRASKVLTRRLLDVIKETCNAYCDHYRSVCPTRFARDARAGGCAAPRRRGDTQVVDRFCSRCSLPSCGAGVARPTLAHGFRQSVPGAWICWLGQNPTISPGAQSTPMARAVSTPRERAGTFKPQLVKKRQPRLGDFEDRILASYASA